MFTTDSSILYSDEEYFEESISNMTSLGEILRVDTHNPTETSEEEEEELVRSFKKKRIGVRISLRHQIGNYLKHIGNDTNLDILNDTFNSLRQKYEKLNSTQANLYSIVEDGDLAEELKNHSNNYETL